MYMANHSPQAVKFAAQAVMSGMQDVVIAGGAESISRVPMFTNLLFHEKVGIGIGPFSERIRARFGVQTLSQLEGAEMLARKYGYDRPTLDRFALSSHQRAAAAVNGGQFNEEILALDVGGGSHSLDGSA
ncbi:hypothetical protein GIW00_19225 [Pseudomonas syringae]|nr:hypothetical protein [Pseudomonas syringae]